MDACAPSWLKNYQENGRSGLRIAERSLANAWERRVARSPRDVALTFFDRHWTVEEVDELAAALAAGLHGRGVDRGDRVGIHLQNVPQYAVILLALWKLGAIAVLLNPMYRGEELRHLLGDSGAVGVFADVATGKAVSAAGGDMVSWVIEVDARTWQTRDDGRIFGSSASSDTLCAFDLLIEEHRGQTWQSRDLDPDALAMLTYTSGTTGPPKGAMNTHGNLLHVVRGFEAWLSLDHDVVLALAPLFHITGAVANAALALLGTSRLVFAHRFQAEVVRDAISEHGVTFALGSITAYNALLQVSEPEDLRSLRLVYSGGAPIPPAVVERARERFGFYIHNAYGMTETSSAVVAVPPGIDAPVHQPTGTLSIGVPLPHVVARAVDQNGVEVPRDDEGELELSGPQIVPGYWNNAQATESTMPGGRLRTGDVAVIDDDGWIYLVDRLKDQINVSGYKVWPREVEDALSEHPAVLEVAVVGKPDDYSGERVEAFVSLREAAAPATGDELATFVRDRLAAYKVPRVVHVVATLPKTETGKIRRAALR
ncbi:hypothetical protein JCM18899A_38250 [Nocardioides sp. AN3]